MVNYYMKDSPTEPLRTPTDHYPPRDYTKDREQQVNRDQYDKHSLSSVTALLNKVLIALQEQKELLKDHTDMIEELTSIVLNDGN